MREGQDIRIVGDCEGLGNWDVELAPTLLQCRDGAFRRLRNLPFRTTVNYKCVKVGVNGSLDWEEGDNRVFRTEGPELGQMVVNIDFGGRDSFQGVGIETFKVCPALRSMHRLPLLLMEARCWLGRLFGTPRTIAAPGACMYLAKMLAVCPSALHPTKN